MVWRSVGCGLVGGAAITWLMIAMSNQKMEEPYFLLPYLAAPLAWWGARRAHSWKQGGLLGLITIGTPVSSFLVFAAYVVIGLGARLDQEFATFALTMYGPPMLVGSIVGAIIGAVNQRKLS